ncbi:glycoside hydrolase family 95-like protein [Pedobacter sp. NJ-S-72]
MLLQSYAGFIEIMPAVPVSWNNISFDQLRAEGAVLVSAKKKDGLIDEVRLEAEKGGLVKLKIPFKTWHTVSNSGAVIRLKSDGFMELSCKAGAVIVLENNKK